MSHDNAAKAQYSPTSVCSVSCLKTPPPTEHLPYTGFPAAYLALAAVVVVALGTWGRRVFR